MTAIEKAISEVGGPSALAARIAGVKAQHVINWRKRGVPAERVLDVEAATNGKVTRHELRPDIYPAPDETALGDAA